MQDCHLGVRLAGRRGQQYIIVLEVIYRHARTVAVVSVHAGAVRAVRAKVVAELLQPALQLRDVRAFAAPLQWTG